MICVWAQWFFFQLSKLSTKFSNYDIFQPKNCFVLFCSFVEFLVFFLPDFVKLPVCVSVCVCVCVCLLALWTSLEQLFWILCQVIPMSPFLCGQLLEVYCVPLEESCLFLWFFMISIAWCRCLHLWRSSHLFQTLWADFGKGTPSPENRGTLGCALTLGLSGAGHQVQGCVTSLGPGRMWWLTGSGWWGL